MGEQRSTASGPMAPKASDSLLCTLLVCADRALGAGLGMGRRGGAAPDTRPLRAGIRQSQAGPWCLSL